MPTQSIGRPMRAIIPASQCASLLHSTDNSRYVVEVDVIEIVVVVAGAAGKPQMSFCVVACAWLDVALLAFVVVVLMVLVTLVVVVVVVIVIVLIMPVVANGCAGMTESPAEGVLGLGACEGTADTPKADPILESLASVDGPVGLGVAAEAETPVCEVALS